MLLAHLLTQTATPTAPNEPPRAQLQVRVSYTSGDSTITVTDRSTDDVAVTGVEVTLYDGDPASGGNVLSGPISIASGGTHDFTGLADALYYVRLEATDAASQSDAVTRPVHVVARGGGRGGVKLGTGLGLVYASGAGAVAAGGGGGAAGITSYYTDFSTTSAGARPTDLAKQRTFPGYDLEVTAAGLTFTASSAGDGSRVNCFRGLTTSLDAEVAGLLKFTSLPTTAGDGAGGVILVSYHTGDGQLQEIGARVVGNGSTAYLQVWKYELDAFSELTSVGLPGGFTTADSLWIRLRRDTVADEIQARVWTDGSAEPATWNSTVAAPAGILAGDPGLYVNNVTYGATHRAWGYASGGATAPTSGAVSARLALPTVAEMLASYAVTTDFSATAAGVQPSGWTPYYVTTGVTWLAADDAAATGGRVLRSTRTGDDRSLLYYTPLGLTAGTQEILARVKFSALSTYSGGLMLRAHGGNSAVCLHLDGSGRCAITQFDGGAFSQPSAGGLPLAAHAPVAAGEWFWMRARAQGQVCLLKAWPENEPEPGWMGFHTASAGFATGGVGLYHYEAASAIDYDVVALTTA